MVSGVLEQGPSWLHVCSAVQMRSQRLRKDSNFLPRPKKSDVFVDPVDILSSRKACIELLPKVYLVLDMLENRLIIIGQCMAGARCGLVV